MELEPIITNIKLRQRSAFAVQHLMAAARFSSQCGEIQEKHAGEPLGSFYDEQIACTSATIMLCVASLESNINEYLTDPDKLFSELTEHQAIEIVELLNGCSILEKYDRVLAIKECEPFSKGLRPYQDIDALISLRNEFIHFHPEWHDEQARHDRLGNILKYKFELSPFITEETGVMFPQRIVSHGCTKWAVKYTLEFSKQFEQKIGVMGKFDKHLSKIKP
jgi:hypothetical protein